MHVRYTETNLAHAFIQCVHLLQAGGAGLSETEGMVKVFEETKHALLYPVVIVWVSL